MLTEDEIRYGYWAEKQLITKPPRPITEVSEYQGEETLRASCTQVGGTTAYQKRIISEWCEALPHLGTVKTLCLESRVNQKIFDAVSLMPNLEALYIKWGGIKSIASIVGSPTLRVLTLGSNPAIQDIEQVENLSQLQVLDLENVPKAYNLGFVEGLANLEALSVNGLWKTQVVASLEPLKKMHSLKSLSLLNTRVQNGGLMPLLHVKSLVHVRTALWYRAEEFEALRMELPLLTYGTPLDEDTIHKYAKK